MGTGQNTARHPCVGWRAVSGVGGSELGCWGEGGGGVGEGLGELVVVGGVGLAVGEVGGADLVGVGVEGSRFRRQSRSGTMVYEERGRVPGFIMDAVTQGKVVGYQGRGTGRPIYELDYNGSTQRGAVTVGSNGFIVGANPVGSGG
jgi:hypothetical protein